jgi:hypothetical protein
VPVVVVAGDVEVVFGFVVGEVCVGVEFVGVELVGVVFVAVLLVFVFVVFAGTDAVCWFWQSVWACAASAELACLRRFTSGAPTPVRFATELSKPWAADPAALH